MADYNLLITAQEVVDSAFPSHSGVRAEAVTEQLILTAQEKFLRPVLNGLYPVLSSSRYASLLDGYVKAPLAQYVRMLMLPGLAYSIGIAGISTLKNTNLDSCSDKGLRYLCRAARADALTLMKRAVDHIEDNRNLFPEYDPDENVLNRVNITSQFVL